MKFSLVTLMTTTSSVAWVIALIQTPGSNRSSFVGCTFVLLLIALFGIAMTCKRDDSGALDYNKNVFLTLLEPSFKIALTLIVVGSICLLALLLYAVFSVVTG